MSKAPVKTRVAKAVSKATTQEASDFQIKEGVAGIQAKPTMYLGELGPQMAYRCVKEEVDNALDEALAGRNKWIEVYYDYDESITIVADKAGGIPIEFPVHPIQETGRRPTAAIDRNLAYLGLVEVLYGYPLDGVVLTIGCDKTTPALVTDGLRPFTVESMP
jgi:hypothetical protein